jgi:hypothetical protein
MSPPSLADSLRRVDRAGERLDQLRSEVQAYIDANEAPLVKVEGLTVSMVNWPPVPPGEIGMTAGEVTYNLRAALDYLVAALAATDRDGLAVGESNLRTQFPIESTPEGFAARRLRDRRGRPGYLTGVNDPHCALIEALQPYNGVEWTEFLRDLSNEDKHRAIPVLGYASPATRIQAGGTEEQAKALGGFRLPGDDVSMYFPATVDVTFNGGAPVVETLEILQAGVRETISAFQSS